jgi:hypothetical protein
LSTLDPAAYDRFGVVLFAPLDVVAAVEGLKEHLPRSGQPDLPAHVTVKNTFVAPTDLDAIAARELMLAEAEDGRWLFRRDRRITRPLDLFGRRDAVGVPYVAPEVQLLFKSRDPQPKDEADFAAARPFLDPAAGRWLADALSLHAPAHPWLPRLTGSGDG